MCQSVSRQLFLCRKSKLPSQYFFDYSGCPSGTWGDSIAWACVQTCPSSTYYANVTVPLCVTKCPSNYYAYPIDRKCYQGGSCPTSPVAYYADDTTSLCVLDCPVGYFSDSTTGRCLIYCSSGFFANEASRACLATCPSGYYNYDLLKSARNNVLTCLT
mgnify:CR=1 FL=1